MLLTVSFIYARFIERNIILVKNTEIEVGFSAKIVVIADLHLGVYKTENFLARVVDKINKIDKVDAVLIPGDLTYYPKENLEKLFYPLKNISAPVYAVLGNHDSEKPGPPIQKELQQVLEKNGVIFLHNTNRTLGNINILGLGDYWAEDYDISKINDFKESDNLIVIAHNPDITSEYKNAIPDLTVTGHTHGGQIRLPYFYKKAIPCVGDFDQGLYEKEYGKVFVTTGVGEVGLPMRLALPPRVDVLELY